MTKTDKKSTENDQNLDLQIENKSLFFSCCSTWKFKKNLYFCNVFHPGAPEPDPQPNKKVSEAENGAREHKKLAPSPWADRENVLSEVKRVFAVSYTHLRAHET